MSAPAPPRQDARRDAVAALLGEIWDDALDPGYAAAARRRQPQDGEPPRAPVRRHRAVGAAVSLALVGLLLAAAAVQTREHQPAAAEQRTLLLQRVRAQTDTYDRLSGDVRTLQQQVDGLKADTLGTTVIGTQLRAQLQQLGVQAATTSVHGPGVEVTVDDAPPGSPAIDPAHPELSRVLDRDLQTVVNGLWAAGAEAVAVNGERLTSLSAIRSAGDAILVDYRPLARPYVVRAIGDPAALESGFAAGSGGSTLRALGDAYGILSAVRRVDDVRVPAGTVAALRYAQPVGEPAGTAAGEGGTP